jgi:hypothetical protein
MHRVELLYFKGCPNTILVRREAERAVAALGASWRLDVIDLESLPESDLRRGYGSPSILLRGREIFGDPAPTDSALSCRTFSNGLPDAGMIRAALLAGDTGRSP